MYAYMHTYIYEMFPATVSVDAVELQSASRSLRLLSEHNRTQRAAHSLLRRLCCVWSTSMATARRRSLWNFVALCRSLTFFVCALRSRLWTVDCGLCGLWSVDCLGVGLRGAVTYLLYPYLHEHNARTAPSQPHNTVASAKEVTRPLPRTHFHSLPLPHTVLVLLVLE